jgi:hypothetical protein
MVARHIGSNRFIKNSMRSAAFLFALFGVWSSFDRDMFSKLFRGFSFDYWQEERPALLFFAETLSIMAMYIFAVYYALKKLEVRQSRLCRPTAPPPSRVQPIADRNLKEIL